MDNPEKLAHNIGHTKRRKTKQKHNAICAGNHYTQEIQTRHETSFKQLEVKTNRTSFLCGSL